MSETKPDTLAIEPTSASGPDTKPPPSVTPVSVSEVASDVLHTYEETRISRGVLTDPRSLAEYEKHCPGATRMALEVHLRLAEQESAAHIDLATKESNHRHALEKEMLLAAQRSEIESNQVTRRGQLGAILIVLSSVLVGGFMVHRGAHAGAVTVIVAVVGAVAGAFAYGQKNFKSAESSPEVAKKRTDKRIGAEEKRKRRES